MEGRRLTDGGEDKGPQEETEDEDDTETITSSSQPDEPRGTGGAGGPPEDPGRFRGWHAGLAAKEGTEGA